ncbi:MAG: hypothetical protein AAF743_00090, partial [Planctomycetota bacterium]
FEAGRFIGLGERHAFRIDFENLPTATAPAQTVTIETFLDPSWDWRTVELQTISFGDVVVNVPPGLNFFGTLVPATVQGVDLLVAISANLNPQTGLLRWTLDSFDPVTGEAPDLAGLLPVNNEAGDGEGFVTYNLRALPTEPTGTVLTSEATIVFDQQPPLTTNTWVNTLDAIAPTATLALPTGVAEDGFVDVEWSGLDDEGGTGVATFDLFVSIDGGDLIPWLTGTTATAGAYPVTPGRDYAFFVSARDNAGNRSQLPALAQGNVGVPAATFVDAYVFYNNSVFDGDDPAANAADDGAIAPDKQPLRNGQRAFFTNYTSFDRGLNGIMIDIADLPVGTSLGVGDFNFVVGNNNNPGTWADAPDPTSIRVRRGAGFDGSDRVTLVWPDNAIENKWLGVTVLATNATGLTDPVTFYFGNAIGEVGNRNTDAQVTALDLGQIRSAPTDDADTRSFFDIDRDGDVDDDDVAIAAANITSPFSALRLIDLRPSLTGRPTGKPTDPETKPNRRPFRPNGDGPLFSGKPIRGLGGTGSLFGGGSGGDNDDDPGLAAAVVAATG